jgi:hypothetical protein
VVFFFCWFARLLSAVGGGRFGTGGQLLPASGHECGGLRGRLVAGDTSDRCGVRLTVRCVVWAGPTGGDPGDQGGQLPHGARPAHSGGRGGREGSSRGRWKDDEDEDEVVWMMVMASDPLLGVATAVKDPSRYHIRASLGCRHQAPSPLLSSLWLTCRCCGCGGVFCGAYRCVRSCWTRSA